MDRQQFSKMIEILLPPIVSDFYYRFIKKQQWKGDFVSWKEAQKHCTGYDSEIILKKVKTAILAVRDGRAVYERDSVLFDKIEYSWPMLAGLMMAAANNQGHLNVIDFGGSLGSSYFQNRKFLNELNSVRWNIVEQAHFVEFGKQEMETKELKFYKDIQDCLQETKPNMLILSNVLQYLEMPYLLLEQINNLNLLYIIIDLIPCIEQDKDVIVIQNIPSKIYTASYPCRMLVKKNILQKLSNYQLIEEFKAGEPIYVNHKKQICSGYIFKNKSYV